MTTTKLRRTKAGRRKPNLRVRRLRLEAGLTQRRLALLAGVSPGVVQLAEKGFTPQPRNAHSLLEVLEAGLGRPVRYTEVWPQPGQERVR